MNSTRKMTLMAEVRMGTIVILLSLWIGCATHTTSLEPPAPAIHPVLTNLPATYLTEHNENIDEIAAKFYDGKDWFTNIQILWHANPEIRSIGYIKAGQELTIPVILDQNQVLQAGDTIHVAFHGIINPPCGFDVEIDKDGTALFVFGVKVHIAGLTPRQAAAAITDGFVPKYWSKKNWSEMEVIRVQAVNPKCAN